MNVVILTGNLGRDPEVRYTTEGVAVAQFPLAVNFTRGDRKRTDWVNVVCFRKQAEVVAEHLAKGSRVGVEGSLRTRTWTDSEGNRRKVVEVVARRVEFLGRKAEPTGEPEEVPPPPENGDVPDAGDDIPF